MDSGSPLCSRAAPSKGTSQARASTGRARCVGQTPHLSTVHTVDVSEPQPGPHFANTQGAHRHTRTAPTLCRQPPPTKGCGRSPHHREPLPLSSTPRHPEPCCPRPLLTGDRAAPSSPDRRPCCPVLSRPATVLPRPLPTGDRAAPSSPDRQPCCPVLSRPATVLP
eukprot:352888-Chlamydomonas_euryale.AAC.9